MSRSKLRVLAKCGMLLYALSFGASADAQTPAPPIAPLGRPPAQQAQRNAGIEKARENALNRLKQLGGGFAKLSKQWSPLTTQALIEHLAVSPPVGPSTIAAPRPGASVPAPAVNWAGNGGGATTGHPGVAMLLAEPEGSDAYTIRCSGTLVRPNVVLTAAHCICLYPTSEDGYATGAACLQGDAMRGPSALLDKARWLVFFQHIGVRKVDQVLVDGEFQFDSQAVKNDVALLVLDRPVTEIIPAGLPSSNNGAAAWNSGLAIGFGYSAGPNAAENLLMQLVLPGLKAQGRLNQAVCGSDLTYLISGEALCSIYKGPGGSPATICEGDSGGPLWQSATAATQIGVTSGRTDSNCAAAGTMAFEMSLSYPAHSSWIQQHLGASAGQPAGVRWPSFGENLRYVLDRRNAQTFGDAGHYENGWITSVDDTPVLATMNSSGMIRSFAIQDRAGKTLCNGVAGADKNIPNIDYCWASIPRGTQFRLVADGTQNESLQYVVTSHAAGTSFDP